MRSSWGVARKTLDAALRVQLASERDCSFEQPLPPVVRDGDRIRTVGGFGFVDSVTPEYEDTL